MATENSVGKYKARNTNVETGVVKLSTGQGIQMWKQDPVCVRSGPGPEIWESHFFSWNCM
jgi:hypothetical protein